MFLIKGIQNNDQFEERNKDMLFKRPCVWFYLIYSIKKKAFWKLKLWTSGFSFRK